VTPSRSPMDGAPIRVYVAGTYSHPDPEVVEANVSAAVSVGERLDALGFNAFVPHLYHHWHRLHPASYERWMRKCLAEVERSDVLLRLPDASPGATREEAHATGLGIRVFRSEEEFIAWAIP
jgi:hypothetical protein